MTLWRWRLFSLLAWVAWAAFLFAPPWQHSNEWWAYVVGVALTLAALLSLQKVGL